MEPYTPLIHDGCADGDIELTFPVEAQISEASCVGTAGNRLPETPFAGKELTHSSLKFKLVIESTPDGAQVVIGEKPTTDLIKHEQGIIVTAPTTQSEAAQ